MSNFERKTPQDDEAEFLQTRLSFALVLKASLAEIQQIKQILKPFLKNIIYQKVSGNPLWIVIRKEAPRE